ncbi:MAG: hypothetical protein LBT97_13995, partial [Planctomycetota bacterium]|nr:hypothetical protein [Planctomycetota bacterium]
MAENPRPEAREQENPRTGGPRGPAESAGVDGETWRNYGESLEHNLLDLSQRLKRGAYRARPGRRAYIAKADGRLR